MRQEQVEVLGLGLCLRYRYESYWEESKWADARLWELKLGEL